VGVEFNKLGYDRYNAISTYTKMWKQGGYECVEIKQHSSRTALLPTKYFLRGANFK